MTSLFPPAAPAAAALALALAAPSLARAAPPVAWAGQDVYASVGPLIVLNGSASDDPDGDPLTFDWNQEDGPPVDLLDADKAYPSFKGTEPGTYAFSLVVSDGASASAADLVLVHLFPDVEHDVSMGCGCSAGTPGPAARPAAWTALAALALLALRRRRP